MNYFAHGRPFLDEPYLLAGTAVPDWLGVVNRRVRVRPAQASRFVEDEDRRLAQVARGIERHYADDDWFHRTRAFAELSTQLTARASEVLPGDEGFRPSFLGHILVEILLDAALAEEEPGRLEAYYEALERVDQRVVAVAVARMAGQWVGSLEELISGFRESRFLFDYADNGKLLYRLNQVMARVRLPHLPAAFLDILPAARQSVRRRRDELLTPPADERSDESAEGATDGR